MWESLPSAGYDRPSMVLSLVLLVGGLALLTLAADRFVVSASRISSALGLSPILIGALVVGLGTSAPELLVSVLAAGRGEIDLAMGNVVGSNTANMTLVLGSTALVLPIASRLRTIRREGALMFGALVVFALLLWNLELGRIEATGLMAAMVAVAALLVFWAKSDVKAGRSPAVAGEFEGWVGSVRREGLIALTTLAATLLGADLLVRGASRLADELEISSAFVGLVIVSVGTSLPELATALAAARRGQTDLVLGNVLGSNLFNTLAVAGLAGLIGPGLVEETFRSALVLMAGAGVAAAAASLTGRVERWEGALLLVVFLAFVTVSA